MNKKKLITSILITFFTTYGAIGQDNIRNYQFKSGEVLDILLLNLNPASDSLAKVYFKEAIPIAIENGYKPNKGFAIKDVPLQGNYQPQSMIVASWPSHKVRNQCLNILEEEVQDFHQMRREIWTNFNVAYYPLDDDLNFFVDMNRYNVATAYWQEEGKNMVDFISKWKNKVEIFNGHNIIELTEPETTFGYTYTPEHFIISSWENKEQFEKFRKANLELDHSNVEQVHQFRIQ